MKKLGEILIERGVIALSELHTSLEACRRSGGRLGTQLLKFGFVDEPALLRALAEQYGARAVASAALRKAPIEVLSLVPPALARRLRAVPFERLPIHLKVAMINPPDPRRRSPSHWPRSCRSSQRDEQLEAIARLEVEPTEAAKRPRGRLRLGLACRQQRRALTARGATAVEHRRAAISHRLVWRPTADWADHRSTRRPGSRWVRDRRDEVARLRLPRRRLQLVTFVVHRVGARMDAAASGRSTICRARCRSTGAVPRLPVRVGFISARPRPSRHQLLYVGDLGLVWRWWC
jgi:hypothetical protein